MLSAQDVNEIASCYIGDDEIQVLNYKQVAYSEDKVGILGDHHILEVEYKRISENHNNNGEVDNQRQPEKHRFFVKMLGKLSEHNLQFLRDMEVLEKETAFYAQIVPTLTQDLVIDHFCPQFYKGNEHFIVLEDLRTRGYSMLEEVCRLEGEYLIATVRAQARLHAASILAEAKLGQSMEEFCPEACVDLFFNQLAIDNKWMDVYIELVTEATSRWLGKDDPRIKVALTRGFMRMYRSKDKGKLARVMCHGVCLANNYLFKANGSSLKCILVDFKLVRYAPRMGDVAQLLYVNCDRETRLRCEHEAVKAYHEEFCENVEKNNLGVEKPSFDDLWEEYEDVRLSAMYVKSFFEPVIAMYSEVANEIDNEGNMIVEKIILRQDNKAMLEFYDRYPEHRNALLDLATELLEYCDEHNMPMKDDEEEI